MRAARQGSLDGLCGVYAVVNSLDLLQLTNRPGPMKRAVFGQLTASLGAATLLSAFTDGLDPLTLRRAAELTFRWMDLEYGIALNVYMPFEARKFRSTRRFVNELGAHAAEPGQVALIAYHKGPTHHWTVVHHLEKREIVLHDSAGVRRLPTSDFGVRDEVDRFCTADTMIVQCVR